MNRLETILPPYKKNPFAVVAKIISKRQPKQ